MSEETNEIVKDVLKSNFIMTLGSIVDGKPHLCTAFYVTSDYRQLYFKSRTSSDHSKAFAKNNQGALSVYYPKSNYANRKAGIQARGKVERVKSIAEMTKAVAMYIKAFAGSDKKFEAIPDLVSNSVKSTMYKFTIEEVKVLDSKKGIHDIEYSKLK